jgi:hypothetical protein
MADRKSHKLDAPDALDGYEAFLTARVNHDLPRCNASDNLRQISSKQLYETRPTKKQVTNNCY